MPLAGVIVNRTQRDGRRRRRRAARCGSRAELAADSLTGDGAEERLARAALRVHAEIATAAEHDARMTRRFCSAHPDVPVVGGDRAAARMSTTWTACARSATCSAPEPAT